MTPQEDFPRDELLHREGCKYCAPLMVLRAGKFDESAVATDFANRNGTLSFVNYRNRIYGITAGHIARTLANENKKILSAEKYILAVGSLLTMC